MMQIMKNITIKLKTLKARFRPSSPTPQTSQMIPQISQQQTFFIIIPIGQSKDKKWKSKEIGEFDNIDDVYIFVNRIRSVINYKKYKLMQIHFDIVLKKNSIDIITSLRTILD